MTGYTYWFTPRAIKELRSLDTVTWKRIKKAIDRYVLSPLAYAEKLTETHLGAYRWRVGSYRIIFDLDGTTIVVLRVGHRSDIYR